MLHSASTQLSYPVLVCTPLFLHILLLALCRAAGKTNAMRKPVTPV